MICAALSSCGGSNQTQFTQQPDGQLAQKKCINGTIGVGDLNDALHNCAEWGVYTYVNDKLQTQHVYYCQLWAD